MRCLVRDVRLAFLAAAQDEKVRFSVEISFSLSLTRARARAEMRNS